MKKVFLTLSLFYSCLLCAQLTKSQLKKPLLLDQNMRPCKKYYNYFVLTYSNIQPGKDLCTFTITRITSGDSVEQGTYHISDTTIRDGKFTWWHSNKRKKMEAVYVKGMLSGPYVQWNENGAIIAKGNYVNGRREGEWIVRDKYGNSSVREFYKNGTALGDAFADTNAFAHVGIYKLDSSGKRKYYYGYIDRHGKEVIPVIYDWVWEYEKRYFIAEKGGFAGILDRRNNILVPFEYSNIFYDHNTGLCRVEKDHKWGYIDVHNNIWIPIVYDDIGYMKQDLIKACRNGKWGYINSKSEIIIPFKYDLACDFEANGEAHMQIGKEDWIIDKKGTRIRKEKLRYGECEEDMNVSEVVSNIMEDFSGQTVSGTKFRLRRQQDNKTQLWGVKDQDDNWVIEPKYDYIRSYKNGMICVELKGKIGFYNDRGETVTDLIYDSAYPFGGY